jgi:hypothetical protein
MGNFIELPRSTWSSGRMSIVGAIVALLYPGERLTPRDEEEILWSSLPPGSLDN